jgi:hypothetical protein
MPDLRPTHVVVSLAEHEQPKRDLYLLDLTCAGCGKTNSDAGIVWLLPGLCAACARRVTSVTVSAATAPLHEDIQRFLKLKKEEYPDS